MVSSPASKELKVQLLASAISAGTETATMVSMGLDIRRNKALLAKVLAYAKDRGIAAMIAKIRERFDQGTAIGYSAAGIVLETGDNCAGFKPGDIVAIAGGQFANHSEFVLASSRLAVKVPEQVSPEEASTVAIGAIALQSVRRLRPQIGDTVGVIGLGLIGQIVCQILKASGARVVGFDTDQSRLKFAQERGWIAAGGQPQDAATDTAIDSLTHGHGLDGVIIAAHAPQTEAPLACAIAATRRRGTIVVLGDVKLTFSRKLFYEKDLELKIATSYGPGRYDDSYEKAGQDYPQAYVRWSAERNMDCYLDLIANKRIEIAALIEAVYPVDEASKAYEALANPKGPRPLLTLISYPKTTEKQATDTVRTNGKPRKKGVIGVGVIGAGNFATSYHLPILNSLKNDFSLVSVTTKRPEKAAFIARQYAIGKAVASAQEVCGDPDVDLVLIATRHDSHAALAKLAIENGKAVFLEKPMATTLDDLEDLAAAYAKHPVAFHVGFNRRFSSLTQNLIQELRKLPKPWTIQYRVAADLLPADHWALGPEGGGRIIGEACHMIDLISYIAAAGSGQTIAPRNIHARDLSGRRPCDGISADLEFNEGVSATLVYTQSVGRDIGKERIEILTPKAALLLEDFASLRIDPAQGRPTHIRLAVKDKGFDAQWRALAHHLSGHGGVAPISFADALQSMRLTFMVNGLAASL